MKKNLCMALLIFMVVGISTNAFGGKFNFWNTNVPVLKPVNGELLIPMSSINDGEAHHFSVKAGNGIMVDFFTLKSKDGVIRAAMDACDVCYRAGKGYKQDGEFMVCQNCGQKFASHRINEIKGGCNPAPLNRKIVGDKLVITMTDIDANSWYFKYKK